MTISCSETGPRPNVTLGNGNNIVDLGGGTNALTVEMATIP